MLHLSFCFAYACFILQGELFEGSGMFEPVSDPPILYEKGIFVLFSMKKLLFPQKFLGTRT